MEKRIRSSAVCIRDRRLLAIELQDPTTKKRFWSVPGGEMETNESPRDAAVRETFEETGYRVRIDDASYLETRYVFHWNARIFDCKTHWFRGYIDDPDPSPVDDAGYLLQATWLPLTAVNELFSDHPEIREPIRKLISPS